MIDKGQFNEIPRDLTLTLVVFECYGLTTIIATKHYLTLTLVVFESCLIRVNYHYIINLTLTLVVFE